MLWLFDYVACFLHKAGASSTMEETGLEFESCPVWSWACHSNSSSSMKMGVSRVIPPPQGFMIIKWDNKSALLRIDIFFFCIVFASISHFILSLFLFLSFLFLLGFFFFFKEYHFIYLFCLFFIALGPCCCAQAFSSCSELGLLVIAVHGFSLQWFLLCSMGSRHTGFSSWSTWAR